MWSDVDFVYFYNGYLQLITSSFQCNINVQQFSNKQFPTEHLPTCGKKKKFHF